MSYKEYLFIVLFFGIPAVAGAWLAHTRGKNPWLWGLMSGPFPFSLFILWFQKPSDEVRGHFRKCHECGSTYPWKLDQCKYCGAKRIKGQ